MASSEGIILSMSLPAIDSKDKFELSAKVVCLRLISHLEGCSFPFISTVYSDEAKSTHTCVDICATENTDYQTQI